MDEDVVEGVEEEEEEKDDNNEEEGTFSVGRCGILLAPACSFLRWSDSWSDSIWRRYLFRGDTNVGSAISPPVGFSNNSWIEVASCSNLTLSFDTNDNTDTSTLCFFSLTKLLLFSVLITFLLITGVLPCESMRQIGAGGALTYAKGFRLSLVFFLFMC